MRPLSLTNMLCAGALVLLSDSSFAHGGSYAGPPDVVPPPSPGSGGGRPSGPTGPTTGQPTGPTAPAPAGPATGNPTGPSTGHPTPTAPGMGGGRTTGGMPLVVDLSTWDL